MRKQKKDFADPTNSLKEMPEIVIRVDEKDNPIGYEEKIKAHSNGGKLHRAFSVFIFNSKKEAMLQLRSKEKHHFQSLWSNPCCSHPRRDEKLESAAHRKLKQELGIDTDLTEKFSFIYKATDKKSGLTEHEFDHVFVGQFEGIPKPNPEEVDDWKWVNLQDLENDVKKNPGNYTPWFALAFERLRKENLGLPAKQTGKN